MSLMPHRNVWIFFFLLLIWPSHNHETFKVTNVCINSLEKKKGCNAVTLTTDERTGPIHPDIIANVVCLFVFVFV